MLLSLTTFDGGISGFADVARPHIHPLRLVTSAPMYLQGAAYQSGMTRTMQLVYAPVVICGEAQIVRNLRTGASMN